MAQGLILPEGTTPAHVTAVRALLDAKADADAQRTAVAWLMDYLFRRQHSPYGATDRDTYFALGRHWCGVTVDNLKLPEAMALAIKDSQNRQKAWQGDAR